MEELQEIEDGLNALEKRGVELEKKLRRSEEGKVNFTRTHARTHTRTSVVPIKTGRPGVRVTGLWFRFRGSRGRCHG